MSPQDIRSSPRDKHGCLPPKLEVKEVLFQDSGAITIAQNDSRMTPDIHIFKKWSCKHSLEMLIIKESENEDDPTERTFRFHESSHEQE